MKGFAYVIKGFDIARFVTFTPDPGVFMTEDEAKRFCKTASNSTVLFSYDPVRIGGYQQCANKEGRNKCQS